MSGIITLVFYGKATLPQAKSNGVQLNLDVTNIPV